MKNLQRGFAIPIVIAIVALLAVGGGIYIYKNKKVVETTVVVQNTATTTNTTKDWKTYMNIQYGFEIKYPVDWIVTSNFPLLIISPENYKRLENFRSGKLSQPVNSFNIRIGLDASCFESSGTKEEVVFNGIPAEQFTQEDEAGVVRFICFNYLNNIYRIERLTGDTEKKILSTFKFTTPATQIIYTDKINGYQLKLPNDWTGYKVVDGKFLLSTSDKTWSETVDGVETFGYASVFVIMRYTINDWNKMKESCGVSGGQNWDRGCYEDNGEYTLGRTNTTVFVLDGPNAGPDDARFSTLRKEVMTGNYLKNNFSIIPTVTITSPKAGEIITAGKDYMINWWDDRDAGNTTIYLISSTGESKAILTNSFSRSSGLDGTFGFQWKVSGTTIPGNYKLKICKSETNECGISDVFIIISTTNQTLSVWPNVNSFDLANKTFQAVDIFDFNSCNNPKNPNPSACDRLKSGIKKIKTNSSTIYYKLVDSVKEYHDFNWLYSTVKNWIGPTYPFSIKGVAQSDGSFLASDISMGGQ
jgi:hypothetical protein